MTPRILFDPGPRYWAKVTLGSPDECWEWQGARQEHGHGIFKCEGRLQKAHRLAYRAFKGPIPEGLIVRHHCDNPPCINPGHLDVGTYADNAHDRDRRGRFVVLKGESHGCARLTVESVREIRRAPRAYGTCRAMAEKYGVSLGHIYQLRSTARLWEDAA